MGLTFGLLIGLFLFVTSIVMPWINHNRINDLQSKLRELEARLMRTKSEPERIVPVAQPNTLHKQPVTPPAPVVNEPLAAPKPYVPPKPPVEPPHVLGAAYRQAEPARHEFTQPIREKAIMDEKKSTIPHTRTERSRFEQQFGGRIFVWLGGIALALAGVFLVKYSIEAGILTEKVRVALGLLFGVGLLCGSHIVRSLPRMADGTRISQALAGAGIADLYGCLFAATTLYHLVPSWFGFGCMAAVTALALVMSLRYGAPIAMLGLVGGYVTPMLIHGEPHAALLFGYLYLVFGGLVMVIRRQEWWWLSIPATLIAYVWVASWMVFGSPADGFCLALFLLAVSTTVVGMTYGTENDNPASLQAWFRYLAVGGALVLMATLTGVSDFDAIDWDMFGLFSAGAIILAWADRRTYSFAPWLAMAANAVMLLAWNNANTEALTLCITAFGLLFVASGYVLMLATANRLSWAGLNVAGAVFYYLIAYHRLDGALTYMQANNVLSAADTWAGIAFAFSAFFALTVTRLFAMHIDIKQRQTLQAVFASGAAGFMSLGFLILLHQEFLPFAIAAQILAIGWIHTKTDIPALRPIMMALTAVFGILMVPEATTLLFSAFDDSSNGNLFQFHEMDTYTALLFQLALPAAMFTVTGRLMQQKKDDQFVGVLEFMAIGLFVAMAHDFIAMIFATPETAFTGRGIFTDILLAMALGALRFGRQHERQAVILSGLILGGFAALRIVDFGLVFDNPLWSHEMVGRLPLLNGLIMAYGIPAFFVFVIGQEMANTGRETLALINKAFAYVLAFIFVSLNVRQLHHGAYLDKGGVGNAEVYGYSIVWLVFGATLLFVGTIRKDRMTRVASLIVMMLTIGKVFLYDVSELGGLWRVVSFLGLGFSLLGLSWFYSQFVFTSEGDNQAAPPE